MPQKPTTLHQYFSKTQAAPMRNLTNLDDAQAKASSPFNAAGAKTPGQGRKGTPRAAQTSHKRKADEDFEAASQPAKTPKLNNAPVKADQGRKSKLQELLGGSSAQEQNFKAIQDRFNWLDAKRLRDATGRRPSDKEYDARTINVPPEIWSKLSGSQKQYWEVKQHYRDVILFFKVGSFYELYEDDAQLGHDVLGWKLTLTGVGSCRQVGCPASGLEEAVSRLTAAGYKVGCMEQVESLAEAKKKRGNKAIINRVLMRIQSPATATGTVAADAVTLLALFEQAGEEADWDMVSQSATARFGFAFLDAAAGRYFVGTLVDDAGRANLSAVLTQVAPKEVIFARNSLSTSTSRKLAFPPTPLQLSPTDPLDFAQHVLCDGLQRLPENTKKDLFKDLQLSEGVTQVGPTALSALAALVKHLTRLKADTELVTPAHMVVTLSGIPCPEPASSVYPDIPVDSLQDFWDVTAVVKKKSISSWPAWKTATLLKVFSLCQVVPYEWYEGALRMDGPTLQNLDLLETQDGGSRGSLMSYLDSCASAGGRRLLKAWMCRPLRSIAAINARLDAVQELASKPTLAGEIRAKLTRITDLERLLGRARNAINPPGEGLPLPLVKAAQSRRLGALYAAAHGVAAGISVLEALASPSDDDSASSALLQSAVTAMPGSAACRDLENIRQSMTSSSSSQKPKKGKALQTSEVPIRLDEELIGQELASLPHQEDDGETQILAEVGCTTKLIERFLERVDSWETLESAISTVDVLCSFAAFTASADGPTSRPEFVEPGPNGEAVLDFKSLWHPCAAAGASCGLVPNDISLGSSSSPARSLLLTGPNMGGKSTILRATCCATIMAQMGCWIPAARAVLSPADRIFTRLGAQDRIVAGESTFLVECHETAAILRHATPSSLVVLDELGRGTSTFDGYAIAKAVLEFLSYKVDCRQLFATHYHPLTTEFASSPKVQLGHMTARIADSDQVKNGSACITFLYKLREGSCPKSYGLQVAQLAGIPDRALKVADKAGLQMEEKLKAAFDGRRVLELDNKERNAMRHAIAKIAPLLKNTA